MNEYIYNAIKTADEERHVVGYLTPPPYCSRTETETNIKKYSYRGVSTKPI